MKSRRRRDAVSGEWPRKYGSESSPPRSIHYHFIIIILIIKITLLIIIIIIMVTIRIIIIIITIIMATYMTKCLDIVQNGLSLFLTSCPPKGSNVLFGNFVNHIGSFWATSYALSMLSEMDVPVIFLCRMIWQYHIMTYHWYTYLYLSCACTWELSLFAVARVLIVTCGDCIDPGSTLLVTAVTWILMRTLCTLHNEYCTLHNEYCTLHTA